MTNLKENCEIAEMMVFSSSLLSEAYMFNEALGDKPKGWKFASLIQPLLT